MLLATGLALLPAAPPAAAQEPAAPATRSELETRRAQIEVRLVDAPTDPAVRLDLGRVLAALGEDELALTELARALELGAAGELAADVHLAAAAVERRNGRPAAALEHYRLALAADSDRLEALAGLAGALAQSGLYREAIPVYGLWIAERPTSPEARIGGITAMILAGEHQRAKIALEQALTEIPDNLDLIDIYARHLAACPDRSVRDGARAVELATTLAEAVPTPQSHETLAMAYAEAGRFDAAVEVQQQLLDQLATEADPATVARWRRHLELYRRGEACCD